MSKLPPGLGPRPGHRPNASKIGPVSTDRTIAQAARPASTPGQVEHRTFIDTYFTRIPVVGQETDIIYNGDMMWAQIILTLETAGPVAVGNSSQIVPVLSGKGQLLETGVPMAFNIAKGTRLYIASTSINRVKRRKYLYPLMAYWSASGCG